MPVISISENGVGNAEYKEAFEESTSDFEQTTQDTGQDIYLLQMSLDRLELGVDAGAKILVVIAFLLCLQARAKIADIFLHWFTR